MKKKVSIVISIVLILAFAFVSPATILNTNAETWENNYKSGNYVKRIYSDKSYNYYLYNSKNKKITKSGWYCGSYKKATYYVKKDGKLARNEWISIKDKNGHITKYYFDSGCMLEYEYYVWKKQMIQYDLIMCSASTDTKSNRKLYRAACDYVVQMPDGKYYAFRNGKIDKRVSKWLINGRTDTEPYQYYYLNKDGSVEYKISYYTLYKWNNTKKRFEKCTNFSTKPIRLLPKNSYRKG